MTNDEKKPVSLPDFSPGDIPPYKLAAAQAARSTDLRQLAFQYMQEGFSVVDANGLHVDVNPAFCRMTGFSAEELVGSGPEHRYWPPEEREHIQAAFAKTLPGEFADVELIFMRKGGERFPVLVNPFAIRDSHGAIAFYAATVKDITLRVEMQSALRASEERLRGLFASAADAIVILQGEKIVDCNEQALDMFGVASIDQLASRASFEFFPPIQPDGQNSRLFSVEKLKAARAGKPQFFAWHHVKLDGTPFEAEVSLSTFKQGESYFIQAIIRDITQRKRMEDALRLSERQYRNLFEHAGDGILIMQGEQVIDCNERLLQMYGISRDQLISLSNYSLSPPLQPNGQASSEFYHDRVAALSSGVTQSFEWLGCKLDGTPVQTEVTLTTFMLDGKPHTQSLIRDITQRKQMEGALRDSELRFRSLFDNAADAIAILKDGKALDCNPRLCEMYGFSREEILSTTVGEFFPPLQPNGQASSDLFAEKLGAARAGQPQVYEWYGRRKDGTPVIAEVNLNAFVVGGEIFEQAISRDITQRKAMEAALLELNKNLEQRVAQRTEELEKALAELLSRNVQYRQLAKKLTAAEEEERKRIARVLHDNHQQLLVAAKFKAEMLVSHLYGSDVNAAGDEIVQVLDQALEVTRSLTMELAPPVLFGSGLVAAIQWLGGWMQEQHQLQVMVTGSLPVTPVPAAVSSLLFRAVRELLLNVSKHAGVKQARVDIVAFNQGLRVAVTDEGGGFDVATVLQAPRSYGLFSIQEQLSFHDGRLDISSGPQRGTICTLTMPLATAEDAVPDVPSASACSATETADLRRAPTDPIRILVADDHPMARGALVQVLGLADDFEVVGEACDGLDALEKTRLLRPDLVLMDATMPRLDGLEATRLITTEFPGIKVIGLSMHARQDMAPQMRAAGAAYYLQKLSPVDELFTAIRDVMNTDVAGCVG